MRTKITKYLFINPKFERRLPIKYESFVSL
nr:MAG TPA: hypothetical protein [Caudoviricetes sp.]